MWAEELDSVAADSPQRMVARAGNALGLAGDFPVKTYCDRIHAEKAEVLATYQSDFYAGQPALTVNRLGKGRCYYLAARPADDSLHDALVRGLAREIGLTRALDVDLPEGTTVQMRSGDGDAFLFLHNFRRGDRVVDLKTQRLTDVVTGEILSGKVTLPPFASRVLISLSQGLPRQDLYNRIHAEKAKVLATYQSDFYAAAHADRQSPRERASNSFLCALLGGGGGGGGGGGEKKKLLVKF